MKDTPEIAPELRGLLEEIVADPRSSMRLAPRRALRSWFMSGERIRPREVATTRAERHLLEAHREALAELLYEAAKIAYWKEPRLAVRPEGRSGSAYDVNAESELVESRIRARMRSAEPRTLPLLRACLLGIEPHLGHDLAVASTGLVPRDANRFYVARMAPTKDWRDRVLALAELSRRATESHIRARAMTSIAAQQSMQGRLHDALISYRSATLLDRRLIADSVYQFNLSCALGLGREGVLAAHQIEERTSSNSHEFLDAVRVVVEWKRMVEPRTMSVARSTAMLIASEVPTAALPVWEAVQA